MTLDEDGVRFVGGEAEAELVGDSEGDKLRADPEAESSSENSSLHRRKKISEMQYKVYLPVLRQEKLVGIEVLRVEVVAFSSLHHYLLFHEIFERVDFAVLVLQSKL